MYYYAISELQEHSLQGLIELKLFTFSTKPMTN